MIYVLSDVNLVVVFSIGIVVDVSVAADVAVVCVCLF